MCVLCAELQVAAAECCSEEEHIVSVQDSSTRGRQEGKDRQRNERQVSGIDYIMQLYL